jgi:NAD(P)H-nitrite reductase large subunit
VLPYDRLLVATGGHAVRPSLAGVELAGVETLHDLRGAAALRASRAEAAVVVGGGFVAVKAAEALRTRGMAVTLVVRSRLFRRSLDEAAAAIAGAHLRACGIAVEEGTDLRALYGKHGKVVGVELDDGRRLACELVVLGAGVRAATEWLAGTGIAMAGGVLTGAYLRTSLPDVWAAGDVAATRDVFTGKPASNAIWPAAAEQGRVAGANMAGEPTLYDGSATMNTLDLLGLPVASFGDPALATRVERKSDGGRYQGRFYRDGRLVGAVLLGDITGCGRLLAEARRSVLLNSR